MRLRLTMVIRHGCLEGVVEQAVEDPINSAGKDWLVGGGRRRRELALSGDCWREGGGEGVAGQRGGLGCLAGGGGWSPAFSLVLQLLL